MLSPATMFEDGGLSHALRHPDIKVPHGRGVGLTDPAAEEGGQIGVVRRLCAARAGARMSGNAPLQPAAPKGAAHSSHGARSISGGSCGEGKRRTFLQL
jgi:hypothetical protein